MKKNKKKGRPSKYDPKYCDEIVAFFSRPPAEMTETIGGKTYVIPPMFMRFAKQIGVNGDSLVEWSKTHKDFSAAYQKAKQLQKEFIQIGLTSGFFSGAAAIFAAKNMTDMRDKTEIDHTSLGEKLNTGSMTPGMVAATKVFEETLKKEILGL